MAEYIMTRRITVQEKVIVDADNAAAATAKLKAMTEEEVDALPHHEPPLTWVDVREAKKVHQI